LVVGGAQLALAAAFAATYGRWPAAAARTASESAPVHAETLRATLALPSLRWGAAAFCVYTGLEAAGGAGSYSVLELSRGLAMPVAAFWVSAFWMGLTGGRVLAGALAGAVRPESLLRAALAGLAAGTGLIWLAPVHGAELGGLALVGLACGP